MTKDKSALSLLVILGTASVANAFVPSSPGTFRRESNPLFLAKKASKRKKTPKTSSGGFGTAASKKKQSVASADDYAIFPALEPGVKDTLVISPDTESDPAGELPNEIYQRLDQIYGFSQFRKRPGLP